MSPLGISDSPTALKVLVSAHLVLAVAPLGGAFLPFDIRTLPIIWVLASIPISQVMLLSTWLGMAEGKILRKLAAAAVAISFLSIWLVLGQGLMSTEVTLNLILSAYWKSLGMLLVFLAILSAVMAGASRLAGVIRFANDANLLSAETRFKYSLFALLTVTTAAALILGLVRVSRANIADDGMVAQTALGIVVFVTNMLATIWATLGTGHVVRRLLAVYFVSIVLGISLAIGSGNSLETGPWWLFASMSLIVVVPTTIVAVTLLVLRAQGYRLLPISAVPSPENKGKGSDKW